MKCFYMMYSGNEVTIVLYDASQHTTPRQKFLYFVGEDGNETLLVSSNAGVEHKHMIEDFNRQSEDGQLNKSNLRGMGRVYQRRVDSWYSAGFDLTTPEELQPRISELLGVEVDS
jgi:hypothetical protein